MVEIFDDRIEITNPGEPLTAGTLENAPGTAPEKRARAALGPGFPLRRDLQIGCGRVRAAILEKHPIAGLSID